MNDVKIEKEKKNNSAIVNKKTTFSRRVKNKKRKGIRREKR